MSVAVLNRVVNRCTETDAGCWEFNGSRIANGYGRAGWNGRLWLTHRLVYTIMVGEIPDGLEIDHLCRNRSCCNPSHLEPVTRSVNIRRGTAGMRSAEVQRAKTQCPKGHEYTPENTYRAPSNGHRSCLTCRQEALRRSGAKRKAWRRAHPKPKPAPIQSCRRAGHPYDDENTYVNSSGKRICRACMREISANRRANRKAAA